MYNFQFDIFFLTVKITVFLRALFFHNVRTTRHKYLRINGRNGSYNKPFKLKIIHVHLSLFYYVWPKFQMIPSFSNWFRAFFLSDIIFACQGSLIWEVKIATFQKVSLLEKTRFWPFESMLLAKVKHNNLTLFNYTVINF